MTLFAFTVTFVKFSQFTCAPCDSRKELFIYIYNDELFGLTLVRPCRELTGEVIRARDLMMSLRGKKLK